MQLVVWELRADARLLAHVDWGSGQQQIELLVVSVTEKGCVQGWVA